MVAGCIATWTTDTVLEALERADIPCGRATALGDLASDPHLQAVGLFQEYDHPTEGAIRLARPGVRFSQTPAEIRTMPAALGQHSAEILAEAGYSEAEIAKLVDAGVTVGKAAAAVG